MVQSPLIRTCSKEEREGEDRWTGGLMDMERRKVGGREGGPRREEWMDG